MLINSSLTYSPICCLIVSQILTSLIRLRPSSRLFSTTLHISITRTPNHISVNYGLDGPLITVQTIPHLNLVRDSHHNCSSFSFIITYNPLWTLLLPQHLHLLRHHLYLSIYPSYPQRLYATSICHAHHRITHT